MAFLRGISRRRELLLDPQSLYQSREIPEKDPVQTEGVPRGTSYLTPEMDVSAVVGEIAELVYEVHKAHLGRCLVPQEPITTLNAVFWISPHSP